MLKRILFFLFSLTSILIVIVLLFKTSQDNLSSSLTQRQVSAQANECTATDTANWCQVQHDPQRTGYTPEVLGTNIAISWLYRFWPEKVYPQVQAIIYQGKIFVGTEHGNMYAFDEQQSKTQKKAVISWKHPIGSPILGSVAASDGKIFFGAMDGTVYALDVGDGHEVWKTQASDLGFSTSLVLAENKVMLGGRDGIFYALNANNGALIWHYNTNSAFGLPILQTAAYNNGKVFFGGMNMYFYALHSSDGTLSWRQKISGRAFNDYWPVVHQGKVFVRALTSPIIHPEQLPSFLAFDENAGAMITIPQFWGKTMHGATTPPAVDRDGYLIVPVPRPDGVFGACWGRLDVQTQALTALGWIDSQSRHGGCGANDENENVSNTQNLVIGLHVNAYAGAGYSGVYNFETNTWQSVPYLTLAPAHNVQGGGGNPASIANKVFYHITHSHLIARSTQ